MAAYVARRAIGSLPIILGISVAVFILINLMPGDPVDMMINPELGALGEALKAKREALGLDRPLPVRYVAWLGEMLRGNLGYSFVNSRPVTARILERAGATLQLMGNALLLAVVVGIPAGVFVALRQYSIVDYVTTAATFVTLSIPSFFLGLGTIYILSLRLGLLPVAGMSTLGEEFSVADRFRHLIAPMSVLGLAHAAEFMRYVRAGMLEVLREQYICTARSKGLTERVVIYKHALRNSLLPVITLLGLSIPGLLGGAVITERIFQWPGMGMLMIEAILSRDYPVLMGLNLVTALSVFFGSIIADALYAIADPRIRLH